MSAVADTDEFRYFTFRNPGTGEDFGGLMDSKRFLAPGAEHWDIYWRVDDADAAVEKSRTLAGSIKQDPDHTPYGVLVLAADPAGADFKLRAG
jgi:predicted enzyme related to lactoylglutathione lyase